MIPELKYRDYDKFLAVNFAPPQFKNALAAIFTFNLDVSDIPLEVSEPMIGQIKFQWWRDVINEVLEGKPSRPHPVLLALKGQDIDHAKMLVIIDWYEKLLENKLPENLTELAEFLKHTEVTTLELAAQITGAEFNPDIALAYAYSRTARRLRGKNDVFSAKLFEESKKLLPPVKTSVFGAITRYYNNKPAASRPWLLLTLIAGKYKLL